MKLTLRELLLLVAVAAMGCGWWTHSNRDAKRIEQLERSLADADEQFRLVVRRADIYLDQLHKLQRDQWTPPSMPTTLFLP